jgi:hypothetical protein
MPLIFLLLFLVPASAHSFYPHRCCHGQDCFPIEASEVRVLRNGGYQLVHSGEVFAHPNSIDPIRKAEFSPDGRYHRCTPHGDRASIYSICFFVPRPAEG